MKLLVLIEAAEYELGAQARTVQHVLSTNLDDVIRIDVEGLDGVTRESILSDILNDGDEDEQFQRGVRLGQTLARKDRSKQ